VKPTSFFIVQSQLTNANPSIVMENCTSLNSHGRGLYATLVDYVQIKNFTMTNPGGINGVGALIGDPALGGQVVDSQFDIHAAGDAVKTLIGVNGVTNSRFTGDVVSDAENPILVDGSAQSTAMMKDMEIQPSTPPADPTGETTSDSVSTDASL
jgi:hypothetical protein